MSRVVANGKSISFSWLIGGPASLVFSLNVVFVFGPIFFIVLQGYQNARAQFAQQVADLALRPETLEQLIQGNVIVLLRNLLTDISPSIQQNAAIAVGRLASHCPKISEMLIKHDIVRILLYFDMDKSNVSQS